MSEQMEAEGPWPTNDRIILAHRKADGSVITTMFHIGAEVLERVPEYVGAAVCRKHAVLPKNFGGEVG